MQARPPAPRARRTAPLGLLDGRSLANGAEKDRIADEARRSAPVLECREPEAGIQGRARELLEL